MTTADVAKVPVKEFYSRNEVLQLLGIQPARFDRLVRDGAPVEQRGDATSRTVWKVNLAKFVAFMLTDAVRKVTPDNDGSMTLDQAKRKDKEIQASIRELDLLKRKGELIDIDDVQPFIREAFSTVRSRMIAVSSQVTGLTNEQSDALADAINDALSDLSTGKVELLKDYGPATDDAASADTQH